MEGPKAKITIFSMYNDDRTLGGRAESIPFISEKCAQHTALWDTFKLIEGRRDKSYAEGAVRKKVLYENIHISVYAMGRSLLKDMVVQGLHVSEEESFRSSICY